MSAFSSSAFSTMSLRNSAHEGIDLQVSNRGHLHLGLPDAARITVQPIAVAPDSSIEPAGVKW